jgi:hypothetical protein
MKTLLLFLLLIFIGCNVKHRVEVSSNTYWIGLLENSTYDGYGNYSYGISNWQGHYYATFMKRTQYGFLKAKLIEEDPIFGETTLREVETTAEYGVIVLQY